jgi:hypothetical protein
MIIVAGALTVDPEGRDAYLEACVSVVGTSAGTRTRISGAFAGRVPMAANSPRS